MKNFTYFIFTMTLLVGVASYATMLGVTHTAQVGNYYFNPL
jgi:hypothetical protein